MRGIVVVVALVGACGKVGPGIPTGAGGGVIDDGPSPAWDWWKHPPCEVREETHGDAQTIACAGGGAAAIVRPDHIEVGTMRGGDRAGAWRVYDARGALLEVLAYDRGDLVYGSVVQDGAPLVPHTASGCDGDAELARIAGKHAAGPGGCMDRYGFFPGVARVGEYAPDAGCLGNVWVVDCARAAHAPAPKDVIARSGWARAKGPARERIAMRYLEEAGGGVLDPGTRAIAAPDGAVVVEGWRTVTHESIAPTETRDHLRWTFTPDGDVTAKAVP